MNNPQMCLHLLLVPHVLYTQYRYRLHCPSVVGSYAAGSNWPSP